MAFHWITIDISTLKVTVEYSWSVEVVSTETAIQSSKTMQECQNGDACWVNESLLHLSVTYEQQEISQKQDRAYELFRVGRQRK